MTNLFNKFLTKLLKESRKEKYIFFNGHSHRVLRNHILGEYTAAQKKAAGIPDDVTARGRYWYRGNVYAGRVIKAPDGTKKWIDASAELQPGSAEPDTSVSSQSLDYQKILNRLGDPTATDIMFGHLEEDIAEAMLAQLKEMEMRARNENISLEERATLNQFVSANIKIFELYGAYLKTGDQKYSKALKSLLNSLQEKYTFSTTFEFISLSSKSFPQGIGAPLAKELLILFNDLGGKLPTASREDINKSFEMELSPVIRTPASSRVKSPRDSTSTQFFEKYIGKVQKRIKNRETGKMTNVTRGAWIDNKKFTELIKNLENPLRITEESLHAALGTGINKIPPVYIKLLFYFLNSQDKPGGITGLAQILDTKGNVGQGNLASQLGEVLAFVHLSLSESESKEFDAAINRTISHLNKKNTGTCAITLEWATSARNSRLSFERAMNERHGKGNWEVVAAVWDNKQEVEELIGIPYDEKVPTTDVFLRIKVGNTVVAHQVSLKKDSTNVKLKSTSTATFEEEIIRRSNIQNSRRLDELTAAIDACQTMKGNAASKKNCKSTRTEERDRFVEQTLPTIFAPTSRGGMGLPEQLSVQLVRNRQRAMFAGALVSHQAEIKASAATITEDTFKQLLYEMNVLTKKGLEGGLSESHKKLLEVIRKIARHRGTIVWKSLGNVGPQPTPNETPLDIESLLSSSASDDETASQETVQLLLMLIAKNSKDARLKKAGYTDLIESAKNHTDVLIGWMSTNEFGQRVATNVVRELLPLDGILRGEQTMLLGDVAITKEVLLRELGTRDPNEIRERLFTAPPPPPDTPRLEYRLGTTRETITVAKLTARPEKPGYGSSFRLELTPAREFFARLGISVSDSD
jgi:hypothetical protein